MERQTRREREAMYARRAEAAFKDHMLLGGGEGDDGEGRERWLFGRLNCSIYRAELIVTWWKGLIVHGDVDLVHFKGYSGEGGPRGTLRWVAEGGLDYMAGKASLGTGREAAREWVPEVALDDALCHAAEEDRPASWKDSWEQVAAAVSDGATSHDAAALIYGLTGDAEHCDIGQCPSARVIWAWLLAKKLHQVLGTEEEGP